MNDIKNIKKSATRTGIIFTVFSIIVAAFLFVSMDNKIPLNILMVLILFDLMVIISLAIRVKYIDKISKPKTQNFFGFLLIGLSILQAILVLIGNILNGKILTSRLAINVIGIVAFLISGILMIRRNKKKLE